MRVNLYFCILCYLTCTITFFLYRYTDIHNMYVVDCTIWHIIPKWLQNIFRWVHIPMLKKNTGYMYGYWCLFVCSPTIKLNVKLITVYYCELKQLKFLFKSLLLYIYLIFLAQAFFHIFINIVITLFHLKNAEQLLLGFNSYMSSDTSSTSTL